MCFVKQTDRVLSLAQGKKKSKQLVYLDTLAKHKANRQKQPLVLV